MFTTPAGDRRAHYGSTGEDPVRYNSIWGIDLSNMNLVGDLPDNMTVAQYQGVYVRDIARSTRPRTKESTCR